MDAVFWSALFGTIAAVIVLVAFICAICYFYDKRDKKDDMFDGWEHVYNDAKELIGVRRRKLKILVDKGDDEPNHTA